VNAPVASAPASQRATGTTPTQLPSTGVGLQTDTALTPAAGLALLALVVLLLGAITVATRWRRTQAA
jgi:hypothetical protein